MAIKLDLDQLARVKERSKEVSKDIDLEIDVIVAFTESIVKNVRNDRMTTVLNDFKTKSEEAKKNVKENLEALVTFLEKQIADYSELSEDSSSKFQSVSEKLDSINFD